MRYEYSNIDRLETPHSYMYTAYGGEDFLKGYFSARIEVLNQTLKNAERNATVQVKNILKKLSDPSKQIQDIYTIISSILIDIDKGCLKNRTGSDINMLLKKNVFETTTLLKLIAYELTSDNQTSEDIIYDSLSKLIKKFEVYKKVFSKYTNTFRKANDDFRSADVYLLLSFCVLFFCEKTGNIKFLNIGLKLNDLLCSINDKFTDGFQYTMLAINLKIEKELVEKLISQKGI